MLCERARNLFSDYCEGVLDEPMLVALQNHLDACEACRTEVEAVRAVYAVLNEAPIVEPPADFRLRVWEKIDGRQSEMEPATPSRRGFDWRSLLFPRRLAWGAVALVLLFMGGVVAPGRYTQAGMYFPWSIFAKAPAVSISGAPAVTGSVFSVDLVGHGSSDARYEVTVRDNDGVVGQRSDVRIDGSGPSHVQIDLSRGIQGTPTLMIRDLGDQKTVLERPFQAPSR